MCLSQFGNWQVRDFLDLLQDGISPRLSNPGHGRQYVAQKHPVRLHVRNPGFDQIVKPARHHVTFQNLGNGSDVICEGAKYIVGCSVKEHFDENQQIAVQRLGLDQGDSGANNPGFPQSPYPIVTSSGRQSARFGQIQIGDSAVHLQDVDQSAISCIQRILFCHTRIIPR